MRSAAPDADVYIASAPAERRAVLRAVLECVRASLPAGYEETIAWGMIAWEVPLAVEPRTYNGKPLLFAALADQKRHMALYLNALGCVPGARAEFEAAWRVRGLKLDMGVACLRFRRSADLDLEAIGRAVAAVPMAEFVAAAARGGR